MGSFRLVYLNHSLLSGGQENLELAELAMACPGESDLEENVVRQVERTICKYFPK